MKIRILATSDVHGYISPYRYSDRQLVQQGLARLSGHIQRLRDENTLLIDNGDALEGSPLNFYHSQFQPQTLHPMAAALNYLEYDYYNLGNHDFNFGQDMLHKYMNDLNAECLTGNIVENEEAMGADYTLHYFDEDHCIALIGVTTQYIPNWEKPKNIVGFSFENAFEYVKNTVKIIQEKETVNGIVVIYHGGFEKDLESGAETENDTGENLAWKMCHEIDGIDVLISGHQHRTIVGRCFGKVVTQTASEAKEMAYIEWDLENGEITAELLKADQEIDNGLMKVIEEEEAKTQKWLDQPLGRLKTGDLLVRDGLQARIHKHPVVSFLNQVQLSVSKAQLSSEALFNEAVGFSSSITMRDLVSTYVYPNTLMVLRMSGEQLKRFIEKCAEYFDVIDGEIGVNERFADPKPQHYNYDMVDGIDYTIKVSNPVGSRVLDMMYQGRPVRSDDSFTIVMSNYRASGGGDFDVVKECEIVQEIQKDMVSCLAEYIQANPIVEVNHRENIKVIL